MSPITSAESALTPSVRDIWRTARGPVLIAAVLVLIAVVSVISQRGQQGYLDPQGTGDRGSRALATLLEERGTSVRVVRSAEGARGAMSSSAMLLLTRPWSLRNNELADIARLPGDRMLVEPTPGTLRRLAPMVELEGRVSVASREPACRLPAATAAGTSSLGGDVYTLRSKRGDVSEVRQCYASGGRPSLLTLHSGGRDIAVLGTGAPLTNGRLGQEGNAALSLNLMGAHSKVVWVLPPNRPAAAGGGQRGPLWPLGDSSLVSENVSWAVVQIAVALVLVALWRVRRLGPVVTEPLPVVVRASETVEGLARLYQSGHARDRAAAALRSGCLSRLTPRLRLGPGSSASAIIETIADRAGRDPAAVGALLYGMAPEDDAGLVRLADELDSLEREVERL